MTEPFRPADPDGRLALYAAAYRQIEERGDLLMPTALEQNREDQALGAAWRRCEAALPEGWRRPLLRMGDDTPTWFASVCSPAFFDGENDNDDTDFAMGEGPTPTAALEALADKLESLLR